MEAICSTEILVSTYQITIGYLKLLDLPARLQQGSWRWRHYVPPKYLYLSARLHGTITQNTTRWSNHDSLSTTCRFVWGPPDYEARIKGTRHSAKVDYIAGGKPTTYGPWWNSTWNQFAGDLFSTVKSTPIDTFYTYYRIRLLKYRDMRWTLCCGWACAIPKVNATHPLGVNERTHALPRGHRHTRTDTADKNKLMPTLQN
jgi:hypothetical protein